VKNYAAVIDLFLLLIYNNKLFTNASVNIKINSAAAFINYDLRKAKETLAHEQSH